MDIPKIVVNNKKSARDKEVEKIAKICDLMGKRTALIDIQTDIWEKIEQINKQLLPLMPKKRKDMTLMFIKCLLVILNLNCLKKWHTKILSVKINLLENNINNT